jgi:hypothetical protein
MADGGQLSAMKDFSQRHFSSNVIKKTFQGGVRSFEDSGSLHAWSDRCMVSSKTPADAGQNSLEK